MKSGGVGFEDEFDLVAGCPEFVKNFFFGSCGVCGVIESPVVAVDLAGEHWAGLVSVAADGDDGVHVLTEEFVHVF